MIAANYDENLHFCVSSEDCVSSLSFGGVEVDGSLHG